MSGMLLWRVAPIKERLGEEWANVYTVRAGSLADAISVGTSIAGVERAVTSTLVRFIRLEVEPAILAGGGGTVVGLTGTGLVAHDTSLLPLFNTARVVFRPAAGKPSQKYLRGVLSEEMVTETFIDAGRISFLTTNYLNAMLGITAYVDVDDQPFTGGLVYSKVQNRQLQRKRRTRAGFKRGWVPL